MTDTYGHLFNTTMPSTRDEMVNDVNVPNVGPGGWLVHADLFPETQINMTHVWIHETDTPVHWANAHAHDYDEVLIWTGGDPDNPHDLGAEIYMDIEGERHIITTSGSVYIPAGTEHCPLGFNRVDRPFRFSALSLAPRYSSVKEDEE